MIKEEFCDDESLLEEELNENIAIVPTKVTNGKHNIRSMNSLIPSTIPDDRSNIFCTAKDVK